jgi:hypothetical protein
VPKQDKLEEWVILRKFLEMTVPKCVHAVRRLSKQALVNYLRNKDLDEFDYVHLSGHADASECAFKTPKGSLTPEDFPKGCFLNKTVTISACALGKKTFLDRFKGQTCAKRVIAPQREVYFVDAALWFVTFYYYALHIGKKPQNAYDLTQAALNNIRGAFKFW